MTDQDFAALDDDGVDWQLLLAPVLARWRQVALVLVLGGVLGVCGSFLITPTFRSATTFLPPQQQQSGAAAALASLGALGSLAGGGGAIRSPAEQYLALMQSVSATDRIVDRFKLQQVYKKKYRDATRLELLKNTVMAIGKKDGLITVTVEDEDPRRAADIANQYVAELHHLTAVLAISEAQQRRAFFEKQLQESKTRLTAAQIDLQGSGFTAGALKAEPKAAADAYARLKAELTTAEVRLQTLRGSLSDSAPQVLQESAAVGALREQLAKLERTTAPDQGSPDYIGKYREFKYQETLFDMMARQYEIARVDESREGALIQIVDMATPAEHKARPRRLYVGLGSAAAAAALFMLYVLVRAARARRGAAPAAA